LEKKLTREQLEHAIRAACDVSGDTEIWIFGSQAILGEFPNAPESLCTSIEVDVQPKNNPDKIDEIDGSLGELSQFHQTHGFYVHGVSLESAKLPKNWKSRVIQVKDQYATNDNTGLCLEVHDLAASKLVAFREKDRDFVRVLLIEEMINVDILLERINKLSIEEDLQQRLISWIIKTSEDV
jgi:hypothetical protein